MKKKTSVQRRGRPPQAQSYALEEHILTTATQFFLRLGYGATSIEAIAQEAGISKRTFYHRFEDKADLFAAVVHQLITRLRPEREADLFAGKSLEEILLRIGHGIIQASLRPEALGLHRMLLAESGRFPELARILSSEGTRQEAIDRIAALLAYKAGKIPSSFTPHFAAEQFLQMVMDVPQRRALGMGTPMTPRELDEWVSQTVQLFLRGIHYS